MKIIESQDLTNKIYDAIRQRTQKERTGCHLSDLIYCNYKFFFRKTRKDLPPISNEQAMLFWSGYALQYFLKPFQATIPHHIDDIYLTPDIENAYFLDFYIPLAEVKTTRVNMARFDPSSKTVNHYIEQMMGYSKALDTNIAYLIVFFACGSYNPPFPSLKTWQFEFTKEEINKKWEEILGRRDVLDRAIKDLSLPTPHFMAFKKECDYCELVDICDGQKDYENSLRLDL